MNITVRELPVSWSEVTAAVNPTPEEPRPVVDTDKGAIFMTALNSWDFATEGSPTIIMLISLETENKFLLEKTSNSLTLLKAYNSFISRKIVM